jgi:hypothetical protein
MGDHAYSASLVVIVRSHHSTKPVASLAVM